MTRTNARPAVGPSFMDEALYELARARAMRFAEGCCGNDAWRGRLCANHVGYLDGYYDAIEEVQAMLETWQRVHRFPYPDYHMPGLLTALVDSTSQTANEAATSGDIS